MAIDNLEARLTLADIPSMPNVAERLSDSDLQAIGAHCRQGYENDRLSRSDWEEKTARAHKMVLQTIEEKSWPWPRASNVKFPILTIAAIQYHARAYPALISPNDIVKYQIFGEDPDGARNKQGRRISQHMTYQLTEEDDHWEDNMDKTLFVQAIVGCAFKKVYYDPIERKNRSKMVLPRDLVLNYYTQSMDTAPRVTEVIYLHPNDVWERVQRGLWLENALEDRPSTGSEDRLTRQKDRVQGVNKPQNDDTQPISYGEQHTFLDLDGDGYAEPYVVTFSLMDGKVRRIIARFSRSGIEYDNKGKLLRINPISYFQKYPFIPSPDGAIYDIGFGQLLLSLNGSIDTIVNQLIDAGTLQNLGGGFLGRGVRMKGGPAAFQPGEWKPVDSNGPDLRNSIMPLPTPQPSSVLFNLLNLLIQYSERSSSTTDAMVGISPGQNTPAETTRATLEQGLKVFTGIYKRTHRALKSEFRKLYVLNQMYLPERPSGPFNISAADYEADPKGIRPTSDPEVTSDQQRMQQAMAVRQAAYTGKGYDLYQVELNYLESLKVPTPEKLLPDPKGPNAIKDGPNVDMLKLQVQAKKVELDATNAQMGHRLTAAKLLSQSELIAAQIKELTARAEKTASETALGPIKLELETAKAKHSGIMQAIDTLNGVIAQESKNVAATEPGTMGQLGPAPGNPGIDGVLPGAPAGANGVVGVQQPAA